jgi:hypothetical protein
MQIKSEQPRFIQMTTSGDKLFVLDEDGKVYQFIDMINSEDGSDNSFWISLPETRKSYNDFK